MFEPPAWAFYEASGPLSPNVYWVRNRRWSQVTSVDGGKPRVVAPRRVRGRDQALGLTARRPQESDQSTASRPSAVSSAFAREKWRQPKNPFAALYGRDARP
jgi:hypothetical protein